MFRETHKILGLVSVLLFVCLVGVNSSSSGIVLKKPYITVGIFIGKIEEGARIFTPTRLLPFEHPEALGHEFPTALKLHQKEYLALVSLGNKAGYKLKATLQRYPQQPVDRWWFPEFSLPPVTELENAVVKIIKSMKSPIPGLKAVAYKNELPLCFIVDTRGLSLEERSMKRATSMGLDLSRKQFLQGLKEVASWLPSGGTGVVIFQKPS
ncbi:MAG: hypothetical protein ACE5IR_06790 [bacterium]